MQFGLGFGLYACALAVGRLKSRTPEHELSAFGRWHRQTRLRPVIGGASVTVIGILAEWLLFDHFLPAVAAGGLAAAVALGQIALGFGLGLSVGRAMLIDDYQFWRAHQ